MSRVINSESAGKERSILLKGVALAIREMAKLKETGTESRDLVAFITLSLIAISKTVEDTVTPWEKRGYWVKADKFRMEWAWSGHVAEKMKLAVIREDWDEIALLSSQIASKLTKVKVPIGNRLGHPWLGAWNELIKDKK